MSTSRRPEELRSGGYRPPARGGAGRGNGEVEVARRSQRSGRSRCGYVVVAIAVAAMATAPVTAVKTAATASEHTEGSGFLGQSKQSGYETEDECWQDAHHYGQPGVTVICRYNPTEGWVIVIGR